ncbi:DDE-type integrase/transposase/recombinase [Nitrosomonas supralitoralis]|uniref:DDE-type integrase/transposase/recombinase n=1 Tax=Nitrosomonas supralitoralis TaxID=2116706 RepID=UPI001559C1C9|nr:DDE-type integrase/transposase/recombinase [Nitrosomonas supralitoralis]
MSIARSNHVWAADITYIPINRGFVYLPSVIDWARRRVLLWRLSSTLTADFCIETVQEARNKHGKLDIFNTDSKKRWIQV